MCSIIIQTLLGLLSMAEFRCLSIKPSPRVDLNFTQLVQFDGYNSEWHQVTTSDGYVLSVFRVVRRRSCGTKNGEMEGKRQPKTIYNGTKTGNTQNRIATENGEVETNEKDKQNNETLETDTDNLNIGTNERATILFAHGMYLSGDDCVTPGPHKAHCYLYSDACHDVWVYNARGSRYSRSHKTLNPDKDSQYWNFAFDEMALFDLPATIDFILGYTKQKQVAFVGHSQGAAILMLLCIKKPEYNEKIKIGFGLSPIASLSHSRFINVKIEEALSPLLPWMEKTGSHFEIFGHGKLSNRLSRAICGQTELSYPLCSALIFSFIGYNKFDISPEVLQVFYGHLPSGTSVKNFLRWGQIARNGFSEHDYGEKKMNLERYGVEKPPMFDLKKVTMRWILIGSTNDYIADVKDVAIIEAQLPDVRKCILSDRSVGHLDFLFGNSVVRYIVPMILSVLDDNKFICL